MTSLHRTIAAVASATALAFVLLPGAAEAQRAAPRGGGGGGAQTRHAVPRPVPARPIGPGGAYYRGPAVYRPYYASPYYWYGGYYGGYYSYPFYFSVGVGGYPYGYPYPFYPYPYYGYAYDPTASVRLQITPREAEVFIDGAYAGTVDDFDGSFQRLHLYPGDHHLEVYLAGYRSLQQNIYLQPGKTFSVRHVMEPLGPGEPEPVRPSGGPGANVPRGPQGPPARPSDEGSERQPPRGAPSEFGALALRVQPGDATVTIDGETWEPSAESGRLIVQVGPGVHMLEIRKDGFRSYITNVTVRPGETTTLNVAMTPN